MNPLYVKETEVPQTETRKRFIRVFLQGTSPVSYSNPECTLVQCEKGKFRSITEIHQLTLSRFPKTTFEGVVRIIYSLIEEDANIVMVYCTQVNKVVLKYYSNSAKQYISDYSRKNFFTKTGVDGYSLKDYETIKKNLEN
jgi:hypothetical protein